MRVTKFLFCAACLCSVGVLTKTALTQERPAETVDPRERARDRDEAATAITPGEADGFLKPAAPKYPAAVGVLGPGSGRDNERSGSGAGGFGGGRGGGFGAGFIGGPVQPQPDQKFTPPMRARAVRRTVLETVYEPIPPEELDARKKLQAAIQELSSGKDEESRKAAADTVRQQLTTQFEADLKRREKELEEVEQRVKSLREQLDKRKAAQADIISLRLQTLVNNANGLGFPDAGFGTAETRLMPPGHRGQPGVPAFFDGDTQDAAPDGPVFTPDYVDPPTQRQNPQIDLPR